MLTKLHRTCYMNSLENINESKPSLSAQESATLEFGYLSVLVEVLKTIRFQFQYKY